MSSGRVEQVAGVADPLGGHGQGRPRAAGAGGVQSLAGALDDQLADELGQRGEDVEDRRGRRGWWCPGPRAGPRSSTRLAAQRWSDDLDQVGQRTADSRSRLGTHQGVAGPQVVQAGGQLGPVGVLAGQLVGEHAEAARFG